ncbi:Transcriptional regulator, LysR family protein [Minicystis rosea]|nr:Transcriptional regulator, LysR family protein [Minicystis rosea]
MDATNHLDEIAAFVHVVRAGSFTSAARQRGVPKSTLSRAVTRLEEMMNARLLRRSSRKIALTEAGRAFYDRAAPHIAGLADAAESALGREDQPQGLLRITAPVDAGEAFLSDLLVRFTARYPAIRVEVDLSSRRVNLVEEGIDVAIRAATTKMDDATLVARAIASTELHLFASPAYLARRGTPTSPEDLEEHDFVLFRPLDGKSEISIEGPGGERRVTVTGRIGAGDFAFIRATLRVGAGIGMLPAFSAARDITEGTLARVLPGWSRSAGTLHVVYPIAKHVPKKVAVFRDFVLENARLLYP